MKKDEMKALQEVFKNDCTVIDFAEEYPGFTGSPRYMISTRMTQEDLEQRYGPLLDSLRPYIYDSGPMGEEIVRYKKNETKHLRRRQRGALFTIDDAFEEHHPELSNNQEIEAWELREDLKKALSHLSIPQQRRLVSVYAQKYTLEEVAEAEDVRPQSVWDSLQVAKKNAKKFLH